MGSVENCVTVITKVSMKCSTKVNEIERHLWQQNQKGFGGYRRLRGVFIKRSFRAVHLFFYRSEWPLSWLVWSIGRLSLYVVFWYRKKRTELLEGSRRISSWYSAKGSVHNWYFTCLRSRFSWEWMKWANVTRKVNSLSNYCGEARKKNKFQDPLKDSQEWESKYKDNLIF